MKNPDISDELNPGNDKQLSARQEREAIEMGRNLGQNSDFDSLTGAFTYMGFVNRAEEILTEANNHYILISFDINDFTYINNTFGFKIGNEILVKTADHVMAYLQNDDIIGRAYADRFVVLCRRRHTNADPSRHKSILENVAEAISKEFHAQGIEINLTYAIGAYIVEPGHIERESIMEMMENATIARKTAKNSRKADTVVYDIEYWHSKSRELQIASSFENAMEKHEIMPHYQGQFSNTSGRLRGAEALARWYSEKLGPVYPNEFIPVLENTDRIYKLDLYLTECVCDQINEWRAKGIPALPISVNISRYDFDHPDFINQLLSIVESRHVNHDLIHFEITESAYVEKPGLLIKSVQTLKDHGFMVEMDDFGSGYSSLNMLKEVPVDVLKLDLKFLQENGAINGDNGKIIINSIINMAHAMNLDIVAEGVETQEQSNALRDMCCYIMQGYFYAKPVPAKEFEEMIIKNGVDQIFETDDKNQTFVVMNRFESEKDSAMSYTAGVVIFDYNVRTDTLKVDINPVNANYKMIIISNFRAKLGYPGFMDQKYLEALKHEFIMALGMPTKGSFTFVGDIEGGEFSEYQCTYQSLCNSEGVVVRVIGNAVKVATEKIGSKENGIDAVTGLPNQEAIVNFLKNELQNEKTGTIFFVIINNLDVIEDEEGRQKVLYSFAEVLRASVRKTDIIGRYGDTGYIVYISTINEAEIAARKTEQFMQKLKNIRFGGAVEFETSIRSVTLDSRTDVERIFK